jgi:hypothetical protein
MSTHDPITGELPDEDAAQDTQETGEAELSLSEQAAAGIQPPPYWRRVEAIMGDGGPAYELAFFNAQCEIDAVIQADKENPHFKSKYASLAGVLARVRPILQKHRLTIKQYPGRVHRLGIDTGKQMFMPILTTLRHVDSGENETFPYDMPLTKIESIGIGSLMTFARRYAICGVFGIATVDDDAAATRIRNKIDGEQAANLVDTLIEQIKATKTVKDLIAWRKSNDEGFEIFSDEKMEKIVAAYEKHRDKLADAEDTQDPAAAKPKARGTKSD